MDRTELIALLGETEAFSSASRDALELLVDSAEVRSLEPGDDLIREGASRESIWMLIEGDLVVKVKGQLANELSTRGDVVGEISAVSQTPATATVSAKGKTTALAIPQEALHRAMIEHPELAGSMLRSMAKYLGRL